MRFKFLNVEFFFFISILAKRVIKVKINFGVSRGGIK